jgi:hypothetical protein
MGTIKKVGTFTTTVIKYSEINVYGISEIDLGNSYSEFLSNSAGMDIEELVGEMEDDFKNRSFLGGYLEVKWSMDVELSESGVSGFFVAGERVVGNIQVEDTPVGEDPNDDDVELAEFEVEFDTDDNGFEILAKLDEEKIPAQVFVTSIDIDFKNKKVYVEF